MSAVAVLTMLKEGWFDILRYGVEIIVLSAIFYFLLRLLRNTAGIFVFASFMVIVTIIAILSSFSGMLVLSTLSNRILTQLPLVAIVIFQQDIRRMLTFLANIGSLGRVHKKRIITKEHRAYLLREMINNIVHAVCSMTTLPEWRAYLPDEVSSGKIMHLLSENTGALIAIEGRQGLDEYIEHCVRLDCDVNHFLLETIFFKGSPLHDGGVIIRNTRIVAAGCMFPTASPELNEIAHTRHSAAIGIASQSDALVIVVSEESGRVSIAIPGGKLERINTPRGLVKALEMRYGLDQPPEDAATSKGFLGRVFGMFIRRDAARAEARRK